MAQKSAADGTHEFIVRLIARLRTLTEADEIERTCCSAIGERLDVDFVHYATFAFADGIVAVAPAYSRTGMPDVTGRFTVIDFIDPSIDMNGASTTLVVDDVEHDERISARARASYRTLGIGAIVATTVATETKELRQLRVATSSARTWTRDEVDLVEAVGDRVESVVVLAGAKQALRESEARLRSALEVDTVAVLYTRGDGTVVGANDTFLRISGFERMDLDLGLLRIDDLTPPEHAAAVQQAATELRELGMTRPYEKQYVRLDGSRWWALVSAKRVDDNLVVEVAVEITDNKVKELYRLALEDERTDLLRRERSARRAAEEALLARDQFLADVSHELRTPLAAILLWSRLLADGRASGREAEALTTIQRNAEAQRLLIDDLLDASRIMSGTLRLALRPARIDQIVADSVAALEPLAQEREIAIAHRASPISGRVDPVRMGQIVRNLIDNAIRYSDPGTRIQVKTRVDGDDAMVCVEDDGRGIDPEILPHIFERFRRGDPETSRDGGLGLGLSIARHLVQLHGGTISAHSEGRGHGSSFIVRVPLRRAPSSAGRSRAPRDGDAAHTGGDVSGSRAPRVAARNTGRS
jgi:PAS domain S-box-containing protein